MKKCNAWSVYVFCGLALATAPANQADAADQVQILERGPHDRRVAYVASSSTPEGQTVSKTNEYTELATGMHYWRNGEWLESKEVIDIVPGGALASQGAHQVGFAANINTIGAIDLLTPDNKRLRSQVLGLAYTDATSGQSVLIAEIKDSIGELVGNNQVIYRDAFNAPDFKADIQYIYTLAGLEQNIVIRPGGSPPSPSFYGMNPDTTRLEVFTEFVETPVPNISESMLSLDIDLTQRAQMVQPDFIDQRLDFGAMGIGGGQAFPMDSGGDEPPFIPTGKTWEVRDGRTFLIEAVQYLAVKPYLDQLAANAAGKRNNPLRVAKLGRQFPRGPRQAGKPTDKMRAASVQKNQVASLPANHGFVIDYSIVSSDTNFTFKGDSTYLILGTVNLRGTTIFEGGAVLKYTNTSTTRLFLKGPVDFRTGPYLPVFCVARDDDTVGDTISGSTGNPSGNYANEAFRPDSTTNSFSISNVVFRNATEGVSAFTTTVLFNVSDCKFSKCGISVRSGGANSMRNCLVSESRFAIVCSQLVTNTLEHLTIAKGESIANISGGGSLYLTNCLIVATTNIGGFTGGANVYSNTVFANVFQTIGAGDHYLKDDTYRNLGTTNINPALLSSFSQKTTYPPTWLSNSVLVDVDLVPCVLPDSDTPDIGYHYPLLDYYCSGLIVSNATVVLTNGGALAADYASTNWGVVLKNSRFLSLGNATNLNRIVRAHMVQERSGSNPATRAFFSDRDSASASNELRLRFTYFSQLAGDGDMLSNGTNCSALEWTHSAIHNPSLTANTDGTNSITCGLTNSVWERGSSQFGVSASSSQSTVHVRNNLFRNSIEHFLGGQSSWTVCDNLIDGGGLNDHGTPLTNRNNAYYLASTNLYAGTSNITLTNLTYVVGPLSSYFQPTNSVLLNAGSTIATNVGLYHFTCTTNQVKETNSVVDIGPHWIALNATNDPVDTDGDGVPDYVEDFSGNGSVDSGETDWQDSGDFGLRVYITRPRNSIIP